MIRGGLCVRDGGHVDSKRLNCASDKMAGTIYSYKPVAADAAAGVASTVLALASGELLELRRGETTRRWSTVGGRRKWTSLEEWKATLPADAVVNVREPDEDLSSVTASTDFERVSAMLAAKQCRAAYLGMTLYTNRRDAENEKKKAKKYRRQAARYYMGSDRLLAMAAACEARAAEVLAKEPYRRFVSRFYRSRIDHCCALMARRVEDGVFVPLFLDPNRKVFHMQARRFSDESRVGATLDELGLSPMFLVRSSTDMRNQHLVTL